jgi:hypothetical protein
VHTSDSLKPILSHLSTRVMGVIADGNCLQDLHYLLKFLAAWGKRPEYLTPMAYQWCSTISEAAGRLDWSQLTSRRRILMPLRPGPQGPTFAAFLREYPFTEEGFSGVGHRCDSLRLDDTLHHTRGLPQFLTPSSYMDLLPATLEIGFRLVTRGSDRPVLPLNHTPHHDRMFKAVFSEDYDEVIADAVSVWIVDGDRAPAGLCTRYLTKRMDTSFPRPRPFSSRLRQLSIRAIEHIWPGELEASGSEIPRLLNHLNVDVGDMVRKDVWVQLLVEVICLPTGPESLSSHYWRLLGKLALGANYWTSGLRNVEVMESLEKTEGWEKLEVWMVVVWQSLDYDTPESMMEDVERVTLKLLLRQTSALQRFKDLFVHRSLRDLHETKLRQICNRARAERLPSESPSPYVSVCSNQYSSVLMPPIFFLQSIDSRPVTRSPSFCWRRHFLKLFIIYVH